MYQFSVYSDYLSSAVEENLLEFKVRDMNFQTKLFCIINLIIRDIK